MEIFHKIYSHFMREIWYWRGEALVRQLCILNDMIPKAEYPAIRRYLEDREFDVAEKLENADNMFWYYAAQDGKT